MCDLLQNSRRHSWSPRKTKMSSTLKRKHSPVLCHQEKRLRVTESNQFEFSLFPNELKEMVIRNLQNSDLKNCRLLSKQLNCIVDQRTNLWNVSAPQFCNAASRGERNVCSLMLSKAKNVNPAQLNGTTPLHRASEKGRLEIVKMIIEEADERFDTQSNNSTKVAATSSEKDQYFNIAAKSGLNLDVPDQFSCTPLYLAALNNHIDVCRYLILRGADLECRDANWWTPLHVAVMKGNFEVARLLLRRGADPNLQVREGWTPLHISVFNRHVRLSRLLLKYGADPEIQDDMSETPLEIGKYEKTRGHGKLRLSQ